MERRAGKMALVAAKCTQCGASIEVDDGKETGKCPHCGTTFVTQQVVNNYHIHITQNITYESETVLWSGETSRLGSAMFVAKILLVIAVLFEIIFACIAAFFDIGLSDPWKTFGVLQACLVILLFLFPVLYFQMTGVRYEITNERISFIFGMGDWNFFQFQDIVDVKIKYALYERKKTHGTIKIKVRNKRFRPLRNHLISIENPEKVCAFIRSCMRGGETVSE